MVRATTRGTPYLIYPGSIHDSSLVPKVKAHITLDLDLIRLSKIQEDLGKAFGFPVDYILETPSGVPLDSAPHVRRSGFGKDLAKFGKLRSFSFYVPFEGQYSHFSTLSEQLAKTINEFVVESNAGVLRNNTPSWSKMFRAFLISMQRLSIVVFNPYTHLLLQHCTKHQHRAPFLWSPLAPLPAATKTTPCQDTAKSKNTSGISKNSPLQVHKIERLRAGDGLQKSRQTTFMAIRLSKVLTRLWQTSIPSMLSFPHLWGHWTRNRRKI